MITQLPPHFISYYSSLFCHQSLLRLPALLSHPSLIFIFTLIVALLICHFSYFIFSPYLLDCSTSIPYYPYVSSFLIFHWWWHLYFIFLLFVWLWYFYFIFLEELQIHSHTRIVYKGSCTLSNSPSQSIALPSLSVTDLEDCLQDLVLVSHNTTIF